MDIRVITPQDPEQLKAALNLVRNVFWDLVAPTYESEGIWEFDSYIEYKSISYMMENDQLIMWGAFDRKGKLAGVLAVTPPSHISLMFVDKRAHRRGVAKALFSNMVRLFQQAGDSATITVHSSPYAVEVYHHLGFSDAGPEQVENGIRYTPMSYSIG